MKNGSTKETASTELTGGAGFTYEDSVVAYYLTALLRNEVAAGQDGRVVRVAVQQAGQGEPLDDVIIDTKGMDGKRRLSLQVKRSVTISAAKTNIDFKDIILSSVKTRNKDDFRVGKDHYGFVVEQVAKDRMRSLKRLIGWAKDSSSGSDFEKRFSQDSAASKADKSMRNDLKAIINPSSIDAEVDFYQHFIAIHLDVFDQNSQGYADILNHLSDTLVDVEKQPAVTLLSVLRRMAREGAATGAIWKRPGLLNDLKNTFFLKVAPSYHHDISLLKQQRDHAVRGIRQHIGDIHIDRTTLVDRVHEELANHRLVNISGLPGSGKSVILRNIIDSVEDDKPLIFLKSDRLDGKDWLGYANQIGLQNKSIQELFVEIGATGCPILFIDGIDRIKPNQRAIITDLLHMLEAEQSLKDWKVLVTSRNHGLESFRSWLPVALYSDSGLGNVSVSHFDDEEAKYLASKIPALQPLLFAGNAVQEIARRPFFAEVLARGFVNKEFSKNIAPKSESELIEIWWNAGGYDAEKKDATLRQRALLDLAETGVRKLGKSITMRNLKKETVEQKDVLCEDHLIKKHEKRGVLSFSHDIFFEWVFFRLLLDLEDDWIQAISDAGEPPLLGRIVSLLSQYTITEGEVWIDRYQSLEKAEIRPQWKRAWLTGPPSHPEFISYLKVFQPLLRKNDFYLFQKFLVWFQAEHTIPNLAVLHASSKTIDQAELNRSADYLGWPSNFDAWRRVIFYLLSVSSELPPRLFPNVLEVFMVWQNVFSGIKNPISKKIVSLCDEWLQDLESVKYRDKISMDYGQWTGLNGKTRSALESDLRSLVIRSAYSYPDIVIDLYDRAMSHANMRRKIYNELVMFSPIIAVVMPEKLAELVHVEIMETLPKAEIEDERKKRQQRSDQLKKIKEKPKEDLLDLEHKMLAFPPSLIGSSSKTYELDDLAINKHGHNYFPASPLHEPFKSLFQEKPDIARRLVRDLSNHAIEAWRQIHEIRSDYGTPIPLNLEFPWGQQTFWGNNRVYGWFKGELAPQPLECAFLALSYWAHQQIDDGNSVDDVIKDVVEGHESWAVLGLATSLALEKDHASETVLPIASCQRLWHVDMARLVQEKSPDIDLSAFGLNLGEIKQSADKKKALFYLKQRKSRLLEIRDLVLDFVFNEDTNLRDQFQKDLASFPSDLPFNYEHEKEEGDYRKHLLKTAKIWEGRGNQDNYSINNIPERPEVKEIIYQLPSPLQKETQKISNDATLHLNNFHILRWASEVLELKYIQQNIDFDLILSHIKNQKIVKLFDIVERSGDSLQSCVSAIAAVMIRFGEGNQKDLVWSWNIMVQIENMIEPEGYERQSNSPWHPGLHLASALSSDLEKENPREDSAKRLLQLTCHPHMQVSKVALGTLLNLHVKKPDLSWNAAVLASDLFMDHIREMQNDGSYDMSKDEEARINAVQRAIDRYVSGEVITFTPPPPAWVYDFPIVNRSFFSENKKKTWREPDQYFNHRKAEKIVPAFPVEVWCENTETKTTFLSYLDELVIWTKSKIRPDWQDIDDCEHRRFGSDLNDWSIEIVDLIARSFPYLSNNDVIERYLKHFSDDASDEAHIAFIACFTGRIVYRHVYDARHISDDALSILDYCLDFILTNESFNKKSYHAGKIDGYDLDYFIKSIFFVSVKDVPGACHFANGDWKNLPQVMPVIDKLVRKAGWSPDVMYTYLLLCERAGKTYPLDDFADQMIEVLKVLKTAPTSWIGSLLPAKISGMVQLLAEENYPLSMEQSHKLLIILDELIDMGDRRSAALEQEEYFKNTQQLPKIM